MYIAVLMVSGGFEAGMVFVAKVRSQYMQSMSTEEENIGLQHASEHGNDRPLQFFGAFSTVLLSVALL